MRWTYEGAVTSNGKPIDKVISECADEFAIGSNRV